MSDRLDTALGSVLDAQAHNDQQTNLLFNPTTEVDSLMERIISLRDHHVPEPVIDQLLADTVAVYKSNHAERSHQRAAAGNLDRVLRGAPRSITVKGFARSARLLLAKVEQPGANGLMAQRALHRLCDDNPHVLQLPSLRHELGTGQHDRLLDHLATR